MAPPKPTLDLVQRRGFPKCPGSQWGPPFNKELHKSKRGVCWSCNRVLNLNAALRLPNHQDRGE